LFADGRAELTDHPIVESGPAATESIQIDGQKYPLYRYTLFTVSGTQYAYFAARTTPTAEQRQRAAELVFGPRAFGVERLEKVIQSGPAN
jgi:hypothetical protein